ncbi:MAG: DUF2202 domain-containing protein [Eubacteriales bacterium]|nr:DUF2202 domain-containing protein [Eubacteriales bacterium]
MKMRKEMFTSLILAVVLIASPSTVSALAVSPLSDIETADLLFIREEEKMARDVYLVLGEQWNNPVFDQIALSEQKHMDAIKKILDRYDMADPIIDEIGVFGDPDIQELYDALIARGMASELEALEVGAFIEEFDIRDLWEAIEHTAVSKIKNVYVNICEGSYNHLVSFVDQYENLSGLDYEIQYLTPEEFEFVCEADTHSRPMKAAFLRRR